MRIATTGRRTALTMMTVSCLFVAPVLQAEQAPAGTYTATAGSSVATGGGTTSAGKHGRGGTTTSKGSGTKITATITSYTDQSELEALAATQGDAKAFFDKLATFNHGTVTVEGKSYPINAATSVSYGSTYYVAIASAKAFSTSGSSRTAKGATGGYIRLTVDSAGVGKGVMYTSTQVVVNKSTGEFEAKVGASTATELTDVKRQ